MLLKPSLNLTLFDFTWLIFFFKDRIGNLSLARSSPRDTWLQWRSSRMLQIGSRTWRVLLWGSHGSFQQSHAHVQRRFGRIDSHWPQISSSSSYCFFFYWREHFDTKLGLWEPMHRKGSSIGQVHLCNQVESSKNQVRLLFENCLKSENVLLAKQTNGSIRAKPELFASVQRELGSFDKQSRTSLLRWWFRVSIQNLPQVSVNWTQVRHFVCPIYSFETLQQSAGEGPIPQDMRTTLRFHFGSFE